MAFEGQSKIALPMGNWKVVDITGEVIEVIHSSLSEARTVIGKGATWSPLVHILHPKGMNSMRIRGMSADPHEKNEVASLINTRLKELKGIVTIMITNNWLSQERPGQAQSPSLQAPFPGREEALVVAIWGPDGVATCGFQRYRRCADGKVAFKELEWKEPSTDFRFARATMDSHTDESGIHADPEKGPSN